MNARQPLTVALVGPFPPPFGGMGVHFSSIEAGLRQEGLVAIRVPVPYAGVGGFRRNLGRVLVFVRAALAVLRLRPDVVHCVTGSQPNLFGNVLPLVVARAVGRPSILSIAGGEFHAAIRGYRGARRRFVSFILTRPRLLVACTDEIAEALREIGICERHIVVMSNALPMRLDPRAEQLVPTEVADFADAHEPLIASVSGWFDFYGSQDLLEAVRELRPSYPGLGLVLMVKGGGDAVFRAKIMETLDQADLRGAVLLREDEAAVYPILRRADVFVRTPHHEGDAISVREALAVGTPVVASDVGFRPSGVCRYRAADSADLVAQLRQTLTGQPAGGVHDLDEGERNLGLLLSFYRTIAASSGREHESVLNDSVSSRVKWYAGRAARMSPREIIWRARRVIDTLIRRAEPREHDDIEVLAGATADWRTLLDGFRDVTKRPALLDARNSRRIAEDHPGEVERAITEADRLLAGDRGYFGYPTVRVGPVVDWHHDPVTGHRWPTVTSSRINHRVASSDPKWIWELNRLQHLPVLAQAWLVTGESRYAEAALKDLDSWLDQNPVGIGIAWRGAFEAGIRAISVAVALQGLRTSPALTQERYRRAVRMLDSSARYCWHGRSRFSSANNHLVGELAGLIAVHLIFPELAAPAEFYRAAVDALIAETDRLILPDGAGAEQSVSYQVFTAELLSVLVVLWRLRGEHPPEQISQALNRSARYLAAVVGSDDPDPRYGDDDDGFAIRIGAESKRTVRDHLGIVAAITGNVAVSGRYGKTTLTAAWISAALGTSVREIGAGVGRSEAVGSLHAPHGGLVVLRPGAHRLTMDVGPLGHATTAAHGHADALAVTLSAEGRELIVDPGTASYYGNPAWRSVHRGTRAHPTVCVDGVDQSVMGGPFYWSRHAAITALAVDLERGIVDAQHDGYCRLDQPVMHRRWLIASDDDPTVVVVDLLDGSSVHDVTASWPLHPELDCTPTADGHLINRGDTSVLQMCYAATAPIDIEQVRGDPDSHLGWWSERLEARTPAWLLTAKSRTVLPLAMLTLLRTADPGVVSAPEIIRDSEALVVGWSESGIRRGLTIDIRSPGAVTHGPWSSQRKLVSEV